MQWFKHHPEKPLRQQLLDARADLSRQIDVLVGGACGPDGAGSYMVSQANQLKAMVDEIDAELAQIGESDA